MTTYEYGLKGVEPGVVHPLANRPDENAWRGYPDLTVVRREVTYGPWVTYTGEFTVGDRVESIPEQSGVKSELGTVTRVLKHRVRVEWDTEEDSTGYAFSTELPEHIRKVGTR